MNALVVYNTLTRRKEPLVPLVPGHIGIYLCGPTVYDDCHIGHVAGPVLIDAVARWLQQRGQQVRFVNNITDIDDKIIHRAQTTGEPWQAITARYTEQYFGYLRALGVTTITDHPRCSDFIAEMIQYIQDLVAKNRAYPAADGVYYDVAQQPGYGKLSGRKLDEMLAGVRIDRDSALRNPADFCLWKLAKPGEPSWPSPWGLGRPGWHIECSVMSTSLLGNQFDIHAGGDDLKFPHHENEIAQAEAHSGCYANCWMHNGLLQYEGIKIGKSDPRMQDPAFRDQFRLAQLIKTHGAPTIRFLLLQGHYRRPNDFAPANLTAQRTALERLHRLLGPRLEEPGDGDFAACVALAEGDSELTTLVERFGQVMDDDFRTGDASAVLFALADRLRKQDDPRVRTLLRDLGRILGLFAPGDAAALAGSQEQTADLTPTMAGLLLLRQDARARRDFSAADALRDALTGLGITVKDGKDGATWQAATSTDPKRDVAVQALITPLLEAAQARGNTDLVAAVQTALGTSTLV